MAGFVLRRTGTAVLVLFVTSLLVFGGIRAIPGNPVTVLAAQQQASGEPMDPKLKQWVEHKYMIGKPLPEQYAHWVWLVLNGDLGRDSSQQPIGRAIASRLPVTLEIAFLSILLAAIVGIPLGIVAAVKRGKPLDHATTGIAMLAQSVPALWLAFLLVTWFAIDLHWLPPGGYAPIHRPIANIEHLALPVIVVAAGIAAYFMRQTRTAMVDSLGSEYIRTARAKGLSEWSVVGKHALRNSLITVVTILGLQFAGLLTGIAIAENVFGVPGFGSMMTGAINDRDYPVVEAVVLVAAAGYVVVSFLVDVAYGFLNPRVRVS
jgi:peptide/nickel transport system permease protein